ncbi:hypothetical protein Hanom_Chr16g01443111 [Helianthus anomalus]
MFTHFINLIDVPKLEVNNNEQIKMEVFSYSLLYSIDCLRPERDLRLTGDQKKKKIYKG